jgi:zinc transporter ZupT
VDKAERLFILTVMLGLSNIAIGLIGENYYGLLALFAFACGFIAGMAIFIQQHKG